MAIVPNFSRIETRYDDLFLGEWLTVLLFEIHCFYEFGSVCLALCDDNDRYAGLIV